MKLKPLTLKDFVLDEYKEVRLLSVEFQRYIDQQSQFDSKSYWIESASAVGSKMSLEGTSMDAYIANDYLGMSQNPKTKEAGIEAIIKYGTGACAAQAIGGYLDIHRNLEKNIGHNKPAYLDDVLSRPHNYNTRIVIIDGVYSQDGDLSMLPEYISVCRKHNCMLMMDDAHGIGCMGANGRGTAEHFGVLGEVDIITGTFSKSFGCVGGFVAASQKMIQYLRYYADSNVFSAAITPQATASIAKALEIVKIDSSFREKLWSNVKYLRKRLQEEGFDIGHSESPIFPIMVRDNKKVYEIADELQKRAIFVTGIAYPAVRTKEARLRVSLLATHERSQLDHLVNSLVEIRNIIQF